MDAGVLRCGIESEQHSFLEGLQATLGYPTGVPEILMNVNSFPQSSPMVTENKATEMGSKLAPMLTSEQEFGTVPIVLM